MVDRPIAVTATRTVKLRLHPAANVDKVAALAATYEIWRRAVAFYTEFFLAHPDIFDEVKRKHDLLTWAELKTVPTAAHPRPLEGWDVSRACLQIQTDLRRAAIHAASGVVRSYLSHRRTWEAKDPRMRGREPRPLRALWLDGRCPCRGGVESKEEMGSDIPVSVRRRAEGR